LASDSFLSYICFFVLFPFLLLSFSFPLRLFLSLSHTLNLSRTIISLSHTPSLSLSMSLSRSFSQLTSPPVSSASRSLSLCVSRSLSLYYLSFLLSVDLSFHSPPLCTVLFFRLLPRSSQLDRVYFRRGSEKERKTEGGRGKEKENRTETKREQERTITKKQNVWTTNKLATLSLLPLTPSLSLSLSRSLPLISLSLSLSLSLFRRRHRRGLATTTSQKRCQWGDETGDPPTKRDGNKTQQTLTTNN